MTEVECEMKQIAFKKDDVICRQGETGACMYCIRSGSVAVYTNYGTERVRKLAELKEGEFFGEMELIENEPRSATVVALTDGTLLDEITENTFLDYFEEDPVKVFMILQQLSQRLRKTTKDYLEVCHAICDVTEQPDGVPMDPELQARLLAIQNEYMMFNMSGLRFY